MAYLIPNYVQHKQVIPISYGSEFLGTGDANLKFMAIFGLKKNYCIWT